MIEALVVLLLGALITALGLVQSTFYDVGAIVLLVGLVGVFVRAVDVLRLLRDLRR